MALGALPPLLSVGAEGFDSYTTNGFRPILPVKETTVMISSVDYYYEDKNDSYPGLHGGIDIVVGTGTAVLSVADGEVTYSGSNSGYGYNIIIKHTVAEHTYYSRYAHLSERLVSVGDKVSVGKTIAKSGKSGTYSPHLHLEIYTNEKVDRMERAYTLKYYLGQGTDVLSRLKLYYQFVSGEYNSQLRVDVLGAGSSCKGRCDRTDSHNHISVFAEYIKAFYTKSGNYYVYNSAAEASLFPDSALKSYVYRHFDTDADGHLSYTEAMSVETLDVRGLSISSLSGTEIFERLTEILTDGDILPVYTLNVKYAIDSAYMPSGGLLGTWKHTDTSSKLRIRSGPSLSYSPAGWIDADTIIVITDTTTADGYLWGKTVYNGISGWCALDPEWAEQLSSTTLDFYADDDGYLRKTATTEPISSSFLGTDSCAGLLSPDNFSFLPEGKMFVGWAREPDGEAVRVSEDADILELCPELSLGNMDITVYAVIRDSDVAGDCNGDGLLDKGDIEALTRYLSGFRDSTTRTDFLDYNRDGTINNRDIIELKQKITGYVAGDCNGDGVLTEADFDTLIRYLCGHDDKLARPDLLDYNRDGTINNRDAVAIKRKLQG